MSFQHYPAYKESGLAWIGPVPSHWTVSRLKHVLAEMGSGGTPETDDPTMWAEPDDEGTAWVAIGDMSSVDLVLSTAKRVTARALASKRLQVWPKGTLLFSMYASLGHVAVLGVDAAINQALLALSPNKCTQAFLRHWLSYLQPRLVEQASSNTQDNLNAEKVRGLPIAFPGVDEQLRIAGFLDRETAKIDALVEEQKRLIELLKEKRQSVISQAVTKGLDPSVPMKDSGVEWLGRVPAHWAICQSRRMFAVRSEPALPTDRMLTASQKYGVLFQSDFVELEGRRVVEVIMGIENLKHVEPDDFIISMRSFQGGIEWCTLRGSTSFHYVMLKPLKHVHPPFFAHLFKSVTYIQALRATTDLIRDGQELRYSNFVQVALPVVPIDEQAEIARFLDSEVTKIDALTNESANVIEMLLERRAALVSAAVTGKIDVRGLAPQPEGAAA